MFRKIVTTVSTSGKVSVEKRGTVADADVAEDRDDEYYRLSDIARSGPVGRIDSVIAGHDAVVVVYNTGLTKVFNWVAVPE